MAKKYYWLKLKTDFFKNLPMKKLRRIAGGDTYTIIYLKLQLLCAEAGEWLYYEGVEDTFTEELAILTDEKVEDVRNAINTLYELGLIEVKKHALKAIKIKDTRNRGTKEYKEWAIYPKERYDVNNSVTLYVDCHKLRHKGDN